MSTLKETLNHYLDNVSSDFLNQFKISNAYKILCDINRSRCALRLHQVDRRFIYEEHHRSKFKYFDNLGYMYIQAPIKYLMVGERLYQKEIKKIRYNLMSLDKLNEYFQNTFDLFDEQGVKIRRSEIQVALYDEYIVIQIPDEYKNNNIFNILMYPHILNMESDTALFKIRKTSFNYNINELLVYADGKNTSNYNITENDTHYIIRINDDVKKYTELSFIRFIKNQSSAKFKNEHLFLEQHNLPIPSDCIISFYKGKLINLKLAPVTGCIFKSSLLLNDNDFNVYYGYSEEPNDEYKYYDNYLWYYGYNTQLPTIINNSRLLPEFINDFKLYDKDISLEDFVKNKYTNSLKYNIDKINDILNYNEEMLPILLHIIRTKMQKYMSHDIHSFIVQDYETEYNTRLDNHAEQLETALQTTFLFETILFKFNNNNPNKIINVYIDGIKYYGFKYIETIGDSVNVYIDKSKVLAGREITFEIINTSYNFSDKYNNIKVLSNGTNTLEINNVKKVGLITNVEDVLYLTCINPANKEIFKIKDVNYDDVQDKISITFEDNVPRCTMNIINNNIYKSYKHNTTRGGSNIKIDVNDIIIPNKNHIRVYKSGKELPRDMYDIVTEKGNTCILIKCDYTICEQIEVEFVPNEIVEKHKLDNVNNDGKISIYENKRELFFNPNTDYYCLNGRRLGNLTSKQWCTKGITLHGLKSNRFFRAYQINIPAISYIIDKFIEGYKTNDKLFDKFIIGLMKGDLTIPDGIIENDCDKINGENVGSMYSDIYKEFLRHNIINPNAEMPQYIAIKYKDLINQDGVLVIDANDKDKNRWLPLDANVPRHENITTVDNLYYELLNSGDGIRMLDSNDIPKEIYDKYKKLFDHNVLVLQAQYIKNK